jgi:anti-sigma B factor antagonist
MPNGSSALRLSSSGEGATVTVTIAGALDVSTAGSLEGAVEELLAPGRRIVINLSDLSTCDSTGLGALVRIHRRAERVGGRIALLGPRQHIADMLAMTGISKVLEVVPDVP